MIVFSLIKPSFATMNVTGSAFITKEEFDATFNDFNSRLLRFEAGINSKIDMQVTSYLDRNGIWNVNRFVDTRTVVFSDTLASRDSVSAKITGSSVDKSNDFISLYKYNHNKPVGKKGLCVLRFTGSGTAALQLYKNNVEAIRYISMQLTFPHLFIRDKNTGNELSSYRIGQFFYNTTDEQGYFAVKASSSFNTEGADVLFFVDKSDMLQLDFGLVCIWADTITNGWEKIADDTRWNFNIYLEPTSGVY